MEKIILTAQDYALALFILCADINCWDVRREGNKTYYYFNPKSGDDLDVLQYILKKNHVRAKRHASRQYSGPEYGKARKVLRVPTGQFNAYADKEFLQVFRDMRSNGENTLSPISAGKHKCFAFWSKNKKAKLIRELVERSK